MQAEATRRNKRRKMPKTARGCGLTLLGVVGLCFLWWHLINAVSDFNVPTPRLPSPNAHDTYVAAGNAMLDYKKIGYALALDHASNDKDDHPYSLAQQQKLVDENRHVLTQTRVGLRQIYYAPPLRSFYAATPYYIKFQGLSRLLRLEQHVQSMHGDWSGSINSGLDALQLGVQMARGAAHLGEMVSISCEANGRHDLWPAIAHLDAGQTREAIRRVQTIRAQHVTLADVLQQEEWSVQAGLAEMMRQPEWQKGFVTDNSDGENTWQAWLDRLRLMVYGPRGIVRNYTRYMDQTRESAAKPYSAHVKFPEAPNDPVNQRFAGGLDNAQLRYTTNQAEDDMLLLTLCLHCYKSEHGTYPPTLATLAPTYLPRLPTDPFALNGAYIYKMTHNIYVLYSVGPDGKDDGGIPIDDKSRISKQYPHSQSRHAVQEGSKGDIVAGINR